MTNEMTARQMLRMHDVAELLGVHRTTIQRWVRAGKFPQPIYPHARATLFYAEDVAAWQKKWDAARRPVDAEGMIVRQRS